MIGIPDDFLKDFWGNKSSKRFWGSRLLTLGTFQGVVLFFANLVAPLPFIADKGIPTYIHNNCLEIVTLFITLGVGLLGWNVIELFRVKKK